MYSLFLWGRVEGWGGGDSRVPQSIAGPRIETKTHSRSHTHLRMSNVEWASTLRKPVHTWGWHANSIQGAGPGIGTYSVCVITVYGSISRMTYTCYFFHKRGLKTPSFKTRLRGWCHFEFAELQWLSYEKQAAKHVSFTVTSRHFTLGNKEGGKGDCDRSSVPYWNKSTTWMIYLFPSLKSREMPSPPLLLFELCSRSTWGGQHHARQWVARLLSLYFIYAEKVHTKGEKGVQPLWPEAISSVTPRALTKCMKQKHTCILFQQKRMRWVSDDSLKKKLAKAESCYVQCFSQIPGLYHWIWMSNKVLVMAWQYQSTEAVSYEAIWYKSVTWLPLRLLIMHD